MHAFRCSKLISMNGGFDFYCSKDNKPYRRLINFFQEHVGSQAELTVALFPLFIITWASQFPRLFSMADCPQSANSNSLFS